MQQISVETRSGASPERVWALLAHVSTWADWAPFDESELEREGGPEPDGVGAIRRFRSGRRLTRERVVAFEPPRHFAYELLEGIPIRDYRADVTLTADGAGTVISWQSRFRGKLPVPAVVAKPSLQRFVAKTAAALARAAEAHDEPG